MENKFLASDKTFPPLCLYTFAFYDNAPFLFSRKEWPHERKIFLLSLVNSPSLLSDHHHNKKKFLGKISSDTLSLTLSAVYISHIKNSSARIIWRARKRKKKIFTFDLFVRRVEIEIFACLYVAKIHRVKSGVRFKWCRREKKRVKKK